MQWAREQPAGCSVALVAVPSAAGQAAPSSFGRSPTLRPSGSAARGWTINCSLDTAGVCDCYWLPLQMAAAAAAAGAAGAAGPAAAVPHAPPLNFAQVEAQYRAANTREWRYPNGSVIIATRRKGIAIDHDHRFKEGGVRVCLIATHPYSVLSDGDGGYMAEARNAWLLAFLCHPRTSCFQFVYLCAAGQLLLPPWGPPDCRPHRGLWWLSRCSSARRWASSAFATA